MQIQKFLQEIGSTCLVVMNIFSNSHFFFFFFLKITNGFLTLRLRVGFLSRLRTEDIFRDAHDRAMTAIKFIGFIYHCNYNLVSDVSHNIITMSKMKKKKKNSAALILLQDAFGLSFSFHISFFVLILNSIIHRDFRDMQRAFAYTHSMSSRCVILRTLSLIMQLLQKLLLFPFAEKEVFTAISASL